MISIIIPSWNTPRDWLRECLESILAQTLKDWETIIVDDASPLPVSPDDLPGKGEDQRFRLIRHAVNGGPGVARNTAVAHARGEFIFTMDSDDVLEPGALESLNALLASDPGLDCAYPQFRTFGAVETVWDMPLLGPRDMIADQWVPGPGVLMRRSLFDRIGGFCEEEIFRRGNEDWDFWLSAAAKGFTAGRVPVPLYRYRITPSSLSNSTTKRSHYRTIERMYERHRRFIDSQEMADRFLYDGYYFSLRRCPREELREVLRGGFLHSRTPGEVMRLLNMLARRIAANAVSHIAHKER